MATTTDPTRGRRTAPWFALLALVLLLAACGGDDSDDDASSGEGGATESTGAADDDSGDGDSSGDDDMDDEMSDGGSGVGTVEVDGATYQLDDVIGITSCDFDHPDGNFTVVAESADDVAFLGLYTYGTEADSNEFTVSVGEVEYVTESASDIDYTIDDRTVSGTIPVVPLFEEGTPQDVTFAVTCP